MTTVDFLERRRLQMIGHHFSIAELQLMFRTVLPIFVVMVVFVAVVVSGPIELIAQNTSRAQRLAQVQNAGPIPYAQLEQAITDGNQLEDALDSLSEARAHLFDDANDAIMIGNAIPNSTRLGSYDHTQTPTTLSGDTRGFAGLLQTRNALQSLGLALDPAPSGAGPDADGIMSWKGAITQMPLRSLDTNPKVKK